MLVDIWSCDEKIYTNRLYMKLLNKNDIDLIYDLRSNLEVIKYTGISPYKTKDEAYDYIIRANNLIEEKDGLVWTISLVENNIQIGTICLFNFSDNKKRAEIGYDLLPEFWGKEFAKEAVNKILYYGFNYLKLNVIFADLYESNFKSIRVLEKTNFKLNSKSMDMEKNKKLRLYEIEKTEYILLNKV